MLIHNTDLAGVLIIEPKVFGDRRGFFMETWNQAAYAAAGIKETFAQDNLCHDRKYLPEHTEANVLALWFAEEEIDSKIEFRGARNLAATPSLTRSLITHGSTNVARFVACTANA